MKAFKVLTLVGVAAAFGAAPASAQWTGWDLWGTFDDCGGNGFEVCFSANVYTNGTSIGVDVTNVGPNGTITRIGVVNVPDGTTVDPDTPNSGPNGAWDWESNQGLSGAGLPNTIWAYNAPSSPMKNGLGMGESGQFSFAFDPDFDLSSVGVAVHAQGYLNCSSKFGFWNVADVNSQDELTGYETNDVGAGNYSCESTSVPEPGSSGLIALGLFGLVFVARRRGLEIVTEA